MEEKVVKLYAFSLYPRFEFLYVEIKKSCVFSAFEEHEWLQMYIIYIYLYIYF